MSYTFPECPRCQTTARPADKNPDGGGYICWECSLNFEEPDGTEPADWRLERAIGLCGRDEC